MPQADVTFDRTALGLPAKAGAKLIRCEVDENGCHVCISHPQAPGGYPQLRIRRKWRRLSRLVYAACHGAIEPGVVVRHRCDNPGCINPDHLIAGTLIENSRDCKERGRNNRGSRNGQAKLTEEQVAVIKQTDGLWNYQLAERFGVSGSLIALIKNGQYWKHVEVENQACPTTKARPGTANGRSKLEPAEVMLVRESPIEQRLLLMERFGISKTHYYRIRRRECWACVLCDGSGKRRAGDG